MAKLSYVREIDGLRAVAVLSVLFFHCGYPFAPGGFIGVDVFFVISGFLITRIIAYDLDAQKFSTLEFYKKRIARIAPALYSTILATSLIFFVLYPPGKSQELFSEIASSLLSLSNIYFFYTIDYFSDAANSPVLHTWSLAIEEQFYFLLPVTLAFLFKQKRSLVIWVVLILFSLSLASSIETTRNDRLAGFYLPWNRAWELMAGSLIALAPQNSLRRASKQFLSFIGLAIIGFCIWAFDKKTSFPGAGAILPVTGAVLCLLGAGSSGVISNLLSNKVTEFFGKISYSLYLIHWPIVCMALLLNVLDSSAVKLAVVLSSVCLAWLSWRFIETPLRIHLTSQSGEKVFASFALGTVVVFFAVMTLQFAGNMVWQQSPKAMSLTANMKSLDVDYRSGTCFLYPSLPHAVHLDPACLHLNGPAPSILLIGDSHAANINEALRKMMPRHQVLQATATGCKPVLNAHGDPRCADLINNTLHKWIPEHSTQINQVIIAARWDESDLDNVEATLKHLKKTNVSIILMGPHPEFYIQQPLVLAYEELTGIPLSNHFIRRGQWEVDRKMRNLVGIQNSNKINYYSILDQVCPEQKCVPQINNSPLLSDRDHFTKAGSEFAIQPLGGLINASK